MGRERNHVEKPKSRVRRNPLDTEELGESFPVTQLNYSKRQKCATTRKRLLWLSTMDPECARRDSWVMTLPARSSLRWLEDPNIRESWSEWATKIATLAMKHSQREVFCH